jgi:hypothetical protein
MAAATTSSPKISPRAKKGAVAGHDQARPLIARGDEHEHQVGGLGVEGNIADLVDDQQRDPLELAQLLGHLPLPPRIADATHSVAVAKRTRWPWRQAPDPERDRQVRLAGTSRELSPSGENATPPTVAKPCSACGLRSPTAQQLDVEAELAQVKDRCPAPPGPFCAL